MAVRGAMLDSAGFIRRSNPTRAAHSAAYLRAISGDQNRTISVVEDTLGTRVQSIRNPWSDAIAAKSYPVSLGDSSPWLDMAKVFVGNVSMGIADKIGGGQKAPVTYVQQAPINTAPPFPTWAKFAIGGGALLGVLLLVKKA